MANTIKIKNDMRGMDKAVVLCCGE